MVSSNALKIGGGVALAVGVVLVLQSGGQAQRYRLILPAKPAITAMNNGTGGTTGNTGGNNGN
ncbi:MAG TPA: hypothetical protein VKA46_21510, partial [Gemmataceae bacterium]|nr:hypothetical protein [Gemmataceae bacterium]